MISTKMVSDADLRKQFIEEIKKQGKTYGLYFEDVEGGFTLTQRQSPQAFQVLPIIVWRVYADGRPDELVRGVDMVGTPIAALQRIVATGNKIDVFNGVCGAESGWVPVSASAPMMLFSEMEVQKKGTGATGLRYCRRRDLLDGQRRNCAGRGWRCAMRLLALQETLDVELHRDCWNLRRL